MAFTATYDACVLHPPGLRDLLVRLGMTGSFRADWSDQILDEMVGSTVRRGSDLTVEKLAYTRGLMCQAVPDCLVAVDESLIDGLELPDPDDRHVLAAAIRSGSQVIVTENLRDSPTEVLEPYGIEAQSPRHLSAPPMSVAEVLDHLASSGLPRSVAALRLL